ncbi:MAG: cation:proton antiporter [Gemmatimonadales bacterium]
MTTFDPAVFAVFIALIGLVILASALASGPIERAGLPSVALFLGLGALLGPHALGVIDFTLDSPTLGVIATLSLVMVLFTDAVSLELAGLKGHWRLAAIILGPGTLLSAAIVALAAWLLLDIPAAGAAILGAALASTDPVMMRGLLRLPGLPRVARYTLGIESGLNDAVLLPIVLIAMVFLGTGGSPGAGAIGEVAGTVFLLGPLVGGLAGFLAVRFLDIVRPRYGMRRDYESLYVIGIAFTAFAVAEALHGSGFMAAFTAGLVVAAMNVELCDCFRDYGEASAEMLLLLSFVAFGASLIWTGLEVLSWQAVVFALIALLVRTVVLQLFLPYREVEAGTRRLIVWFGPRALSSLLLVLLPVFAGVPGSERLFPIAALVVLFSVLIHGAGLAVLTRQLREARPEPRPAVSPWAGGPKPAPAGDLRGAELVADRERITFEELAALQQAGAPVRLLDVRREPDFMRLDRKARGAVRMHPDRAVRSAAAEALPKHDWLVAYCA